MTSIFLDTNIPMYAAGGPHILRTPCRRVMTLLDAAPNAFVTDAEVMQEIIHRYVSLRRWPQGRVVFSIFARAMRGRIEPVNAIDTEQAAAFADSYPHLSARDLIHAAVMQRLGVTRIVSTDGGFDHIDDIERLDPLFVEDWAETVSSEG